MAIASLRRFEVLDKADHCPYTETKDSPLHAYLAAHPTDSKVSLIDLGPSAARALAANGYWSGLHPNMRGHAVFAAQILAAMEKNINASGR